MKHAIASFAICAGLLVPSGGLCYGTTGHISRCELRHARTRWNYPGGTW
jgi:hypothetical protein